MIFGHRGRAFGARSVAAVAINADCDAFGASLAGVITLRTSAGQLLIAEHNVVGVQKVLTEKPKAERATIVWRTYRSRCAVGRCRSRPGSGITKLGADVLE